jgi:hypothetical protein
VPPVSQGGYGVAFLKKISPWLNKLLFMAPLIKGILVKNRFSDDAVNKSLKGFLKSYM